MRTLSSLILDKMLYFVLLIRRINVGWNGRKSTCSAIKAFSLFEVLLTLAIVGVVACLTITTLIQNIGDSALKTQWKDTYSIINQATKRVLIDNLSLKALCNDWSGTCLKDIYLPYLNYSKSCNDWNSAGICWHSNGVVKELNGTSQDVASTYAGVILSNGAFVKMEYEDRDCNTTYGTASVKICGAMHVDVNGFKGPNMVGKDIFGVVIMEKEIRPLGTPNGFHVPPTSTCIVGDTNAGNDGWYCSNLYLRQ